MTIINQKSISGITSITFASAGDDLLTFHSNNGTERFRIDNSGNTKITAGIVTTLTVTGNGTVGGTLGVTGETTFSTHINLGDSDKAKFGASGDLEIYHNGTNSFIENSTGELLLRAKAGENSINCNPDGSVELYHDNSKKLETTATGVTIPGTVIADGLSLGDSEYAYFGASNDLQIYHDGSHSYVKDGGTGSLILLGDDVLIKNAAETENKARFHSDGNVELYYDNSKKFETQTSGIIVHEDTDKSIRFTGGIGEIGNVTGFQATNTAGSAIVDFGMRGTTLRFATGSAERMRVTDNGITFNGDTAAANALDDYEEGTSTTSITSLTADTNQVVMKYVKIGSLVTVVGVITITNITASSGSNGNFNLPFTPTAYATSVPGADIQRNDIDTSTKYLGTYGGNPQVYFNAENGGYRSTNSLSAGKIGFTITYTTF